MISAKPNTKRKNEHHVKWLWAQLRGNRSFFVKSLILTFIVHSMGILNPMLSQHLIDDVITPGDTRLLLPILGLMLLVTATRFAIDFYNNICFETQGYISMSLIRKKMFEMIQRQDFRFLGKFPTGNMMTRMTQDVDRIRHTTSYLGIWSVMCVLLFVIGFAYLFSINWQLTLLLMAVNPIIIYVSRRFSKKMRPRYENVREKLTKLGDAVTENIDGNRVVKAFAREDYEIEQFEKKNVEYRDLTYENAVISARFQPVMGFLNNLIGLLTLLGGGYFLIKGSMTPGQYLAYSSYTWTLNWSMTMLPNILSDLQWYNASAPMVREVIDAPEGFTDIPGALYLSERLKGTLEFKDVTLVLGGNTILDKINFRAEAGQTIGILGGTGSGKTSLINLINHLYEPDSGEILLDGVEMRQYTMSSLRRQIGVAMQDVFLFSDSVRNNIAYGRPDLGEETVIRRASQADADSFITGMEYKYETLVGERGVGLSGGQRQRIALARALAVKPAILILDDTTSAVDSETEQYIQESLRNLDFDCTKIIIAQRISSFRGAKQILVMDKGRVIERGTHEELLAARGFYHHIWSLQNNSFPEGKEIWEESEEKAGAAGTAGGEANNG